MPSNATRYERIRAGRAVPEDHDALARAGVRSPFQRITLVERGAEARLFQALVNGEAEALAKAGHSVDREEIALRVAEERPDLADSAFRQRFGRRR